MPNKEFEKFEMELIKKGNLLKKKRDLLVSTPIKENENQLVEIENEIKDLNDNVKKLRLEQHELAYFSPKGFFSPPPFVVEAIIDILENQTFDFCLDPWAINGLLLSSLVETGIVKKGIGICLEPNQFNYCKELSQGLKIEWVNALPLEWIGETADKYDLIISSPPWGVMVVANMFEKREYVNGIKDSDDALLLLLSCQKLKPDGIGIFITPKRFILQNRPNGVYANLNKFGLTVDAVLSVPSGSFEPMTSLGGDIVIIRKSQPIPIFTGRLLPDPVQRKKTIDNLNNRRQDQDIIFGAIVKPDEFHGFDALEKQDRVKRIGLKFGYPPCNLGDITTEVTRVRENDTSPADKENTVFLPRLGTSPAVTKVSSFAIKPHNYVQISIDPTKADAEYIAGLFNSPFGRTLRDQAVSGAVIPKITKNSVDQMIIFLPPLADQKKIIEADQRAKAVEDDLQNIRDRLWSEPRKLNTLLPKLDRMTREESFKEWLDDLPYPLSSILWTYNAAGTNEEKRFRHLLHFFEATAEFMATIHLSSVRGDQGLKQELLPPIMQKLNEKNIPLQRASFGTWQFIYSNLAKKVRALYDNPETREQTCQLYKTHDSEVMQMLTSRELATLFELVNTARNNWTGHGPEVSDAEAANRHNILKGHLQTLRRIFGSNWDRYQLVYPMEIRYINKTFRQNVQRVTGTTSTPFEQVNLDLEVPLEEGYLYLSGLGEREALQVLPLVRMQPSPRSAMNACYFFSKKTSGKLKFVSYHFDTEAEIEDAFPDVEAALNGLVSSGDNLSTQTNSGA